MLEKFIENAREDSLTAAVFSHLLHLPSEVFWRILRNACYTDHLPEYAGEPKSVEPWPNWDPEGTDNSNRVIPDLFIRFADFDLIIEAKRWDADMQEPSQWKNEVTAYAKEYGKDKVLVSKDKVLVRMIALGGIRDMEDDEVVLPTITCPVHMCKWAHVLAECQHMKKELERLKYPSSHTQACVRILTHLIDLFAWHGYSTGLWFADFNFERHHLSSSISAHLHLFQNRSKKLSII